MTIVVEGIARAAKMRFVTKTSKNNETRLTIAVKRYESRFSGRLVRRNRAVFASHNVRYVNLHLISRLSDCGKLPRFRPTSAGSTARPGRPAGHRGPACLPCPRPDLDAEGMADLYAHRPTSAG